MNKFKLLEGLIARFETLMDERDDILGEEHPWFDEAGAERVLIVSPRRERNNIAMESVCKAIADEMAKFKKPPVEPKQQELLPLD